ncbi:MAG: CaiB/BaiF CoA transferase family protein [Candidatus Competibacterales bacterium]
MSQSSASQPGALAGLRIIDLTRVLGGPYCTQILADHGALVIKVEPPQGDEVRDWGPPFQNDDASYFIGLNRNKRSLGLDLTKPQGREVLLKLLDGADVLIENLKPGTLERFELGYETVLAPRFPTLIHSRISGYGGDGPLGGLPGYDAIVQAQTGWFSVNGAEEGDPTRVGIPLVDMGTGLFAAVAVLMALFERQRSGKGQFLDLTLYDCALALQHPHAANYFLSNRNPRPTGNAHPNISPYDRYRTQTGNIFIGAGNARAFRRLCQVLERPDLTGDPRFASNGDRVVNRRALTQELEATLAERDGEALCRELLAAGVPAGPVLDVAEALAAPHTQHRQMVAALDDYRCPNTPIKFSRTPGTVQSRPPAFGAHSREVLREAGFDAAEIETLIAAEAVLERRRRS